MVDQQKLWKRLTWVGVLLAAVTANAQQLSGGFRHGVYINPSNELIGWGKNEYGELNSSVNGVIPPKKIHESHWKVIQGGYDYTIGIQRDGTLWVGGYNRAGQLGLGNFELDALHYTQVGDDTEWKDVSAGYSHVLAVKNDGTLWAWGNNQKFQLGTLNDEIQNLPVQVGNDKDWETIVAGYDNSLALKQDGSLWAWGNNYFGQLGLGYKSDFVVVPSKVIADKKWISVKSGISSSGGIQEDGSLWMWGRNYHGQLGNGSNEDTFSPKQVTSEQPWKSVTLGKNHSLAIQADGTLWSWGQNISGELGTGIAMGYAVYVSRPVRVSEDTNWVETAASEYFSLASKKDGTVWGWGSNKWGQLASTNVLEEKPILIYTSPKLGTTTLVHTAQLKIVPTLVNDYLTMVNKDEFVIKEASIINLQGQKIRSLRNLTPQIHVQDLSKGVYFLRVITDKKVFNLRFIKH